MRHLHSGSDALSIITGHLLDGGWLHRLHQASSQGTSSQDAGYTGNMQASSRHFLSEDWLHRLNIISGHFLAERAVQARSYEDDSSMAKSRAPQAGKSYKDDSSTAKSSWALQTRKLAMALIHQRLSHYGHLRHAARTIHHWPRHDSSWAPQACFKDESMAKSSWAPQVSYQADTSLVESSWATHLIHHWQSHHGQQR